MKKLSKADKEFERSLFLSAEKWLCQHIEFTGEMKHVDDGKQDILISLPWPQVVKLLVHFHCHETVRRQGKGHDAQ